MNYAAILAGGTGSRVKSVNIPKQFVEINGEPVIYYTIKNMLKPNIFDRIYIAAHRDWIHFMNDLVSERFAEVKDKIRIIPGGKERMDTIHNVISAIGADFDIKDDDVIVIHDAARPFVTERVLKDSVSAVAEYGAVVAAVSAADTMLISEGGETVDNIPRRNTIFHGQAPDSFRLKLFRDMLDNLSEEQRKNVTGTSQICTLNDHRLHMIRGDALNFKITTDFDLLVAEKIAEKQKEIIPNE